MTVCSSKCDIFNSILYDVIWFYLLTYEYDINFQDTIKTKSDLLFQAIVSALRKRFKNYLNDWWNRLDWTVMLAYTSAMGFKIGDDQIYHDTSKILLVVTFILLSIRILHMFSMSKFLGPKLVMIQKMVSFF